MPLLASLGLFGAKGYGFTGGTLAAPTNTVAPAISGTAQNRQTLTCSTGTWTGSPTSYSYQWKRGVTNVGTNSSTYTLVTADVGSTMTCTVTATNAVGSGNATSSATATVTANTALAPTIGTATSTGATTATVSYTAPADNGGATITSYTAVSSPGSITGTLVTAASGTISVSGLSASTSYTFTVYATNSAGNGASSSASNSITTSAIAPTNATAPVVSGTPTIGSFYPTTNGTWNNTPTSYSYQWYNAGTNAVIAGQTSQNFNPGNDATYLGITLKCLVTATNAAGSGTAFSNTSAAVVAAAPGAPTIGTATATGSTTATVTYTASAYNNGSTITRYDAYNNLGTLVGTLATAGSGTINCTGLSAATSYNFTVKAVNSIGASAASSSSNTITTNSPTMSVVVGNDTSPYVSAYPWTDASGFGTKFSNPTASGITAYTVDFNVGATYVIAAAFAGNNFDIWPWSHSTGFGTRVAAPATLPPNYGYSANFSAQGTSIAVGSSTTQFITVYPFSAGAVGTKYANPSTLPAIGAVQDVAFSAAGTEIVLAGDTSPFIAAYSYTAGTGFGAKLTSPTLGGQAKGLAFTSTGPTLAVAGYMTGSTATYPWSTSGFGTVYSTPGTGISSLGLSAGWDPTGVNVAFGSFASPWVQVYQFTTASGFGTKYSNPATTPTGNGNSVAFSGTGNSIVVGHSTTPFVTGYPFSKAQSPTFGTGFGTKFTNPATLPTGNVYGVSIGST